MEGLYGQVSNLLEHGHPAAEEYPIWLIWFQNQLIVERVNSLIATEAVVFQAALTTTAMTQDGGRKAIAQFTKIIKGLTE